jgi:plastocyanin
VKLGSIVCWYNVGLDVHTVTGGPWNDSGDLQKTQSYIWVANVPGLHAYRCRYTQPQMQSTLRVLP